MTHLSGIPATAIPCGPLFRTFKGLILSNQQWTGLPEEMYAGYFTGSFFTAYSAVRHSPSPLYILDNISPSNLKYCIKNKETLIGSRIYNFLFLNC